MRLLRKLLTYIHDGINADPDSRPALVISHYSANLRIIATESHFVITENGFERLNVVVTIAQLADLVRSNGFMVEINTDYASYPARTLLETERVFNPDTGDFVHTIGVYRSVLFVILDLFAVVLEKARLDIIEMLKQLYLHSAEQNWLDEWGSYFGIVRRLGEADTDYRPRIITEIIRPKSNNIAIELILADIFGQVLPMIDSTLNATWFKYPVVFDLLNGALANPHRSR